MEGKSQKKRLAVPEISSEMPIAHSEIVNSKNFRYSDVHTKTKCNPNQKLNKVMNLKLDYQEPDKESDLLCQEIKNLTTSEPITEKEEIEKWDITAISQSSLGQEQKQRPNELAY